MINTNGFGKWKNKKGHISPNFQIMMRDAVFKVLRNSDKSSLRSCGRTHTRSNVTPTSGDNTKKRKKPWISVGIEPGTSRFAKQRVQFYHQLDYRTFVPVNTSLNNVDAT